MDKKEERHGISFDRLLPYLTLEFKREVSKDLETVKKTFVLDSDRAYKTLHAVLRYNVEEEDKKVNKEKKRNIFGWHTSTNK